MPMPRLQTSASSAPHPLYIGNVNDTRHFFYLFVNFIIYLIFGSIANVWALAKDTTQIAHWIAEKLPEFARVFINLIILQGIPIHSKRWLIVRVWNVPLPTLAVRFAIRVSIRPHRMQNPTRFPRTKGSSTIQFRDIPATADPRPDHLSELQRYETAHSCRWIVLFLHRLLRL